MCPGICHPVIAIIVESRALVFMPHQLTDFVDVDFTGVYQCADVGLADFVHGLHRGHGMAAVFPYPAVERSGMDALSVFSQEEKRMMVRQPCPPQASERAGDRSVVMDTRFNRQVPY